MRRLLLALALVAATLGITAGTAEARLTNCGVAGSGGTVHTACYSFDPSTNGSAQRARAICWYWADTYWIGTVIVGAWRGIGQVSTATCWTGIVTHPGAETY